MGQSAAAGVLLLDDVSLFDSVDELEELEELSEEELPLLPAGEDASEVLRLSVTYQPLPLKTIAGGVRTRRASSPQTSHVCTAGASKPSRFSYWWPALQR
jgi:hypothetical protein